MTLFGAFIPINLLAPTVAVISLTYYFLGSFLATFYALALFPALVIWMIFLLSLPNPVGRLVLPWSWERSLLVRYQISTHFQLWQTLNLIYRI